MELSNHQFTELFDQLGLASDSASIESFIASHRPVDETIDLWSASFWSPAQSQFLRESLKADADWAPVVDQLNVALRN
jgi:hypothetical protein